MPLPTLSDRRGYFLAGLLLLIYVSVALAGVRNKSMTFDEIAHITAGRAYWTYGDYRFHPENGNLPQRWVALPAVLTSEWKFPGSDHPGWAGSNVWSLGDTYFHDLGNPLDQMLFAARAAAVLFGVGVACQVYFWGRYLWGVGGGLLALAVCALDPTMLAHGPLATSDMCLTCFLLAAVTGVWAVLQRVSWARLLGCTLALGGLFLAKHSAGIVVVIAAALVLIRVWAGPPLVLALGRRERVVASRWGRLLAALGAAAVCTVGTSALVWAGYGFRYAGHNTTELPHAEFHGFWQNEGALVPVDGKPRMSTTTWNVLQAIDRHRLLPEAYTFGTAFVLASRVRMAFLRGEFSETGWPGFFPYCFLVKTPLPLFGLLAVAAVAALRRSPAAPGSVGGTAPPLWYRTAPLWVLWVVYWGFAVNSTLNIGHRHILPTYPPLFVLAGAAALWVRRPMGWAGWAVVGLLAWSVGVAATTFPHYLAYFNPLLPPEKAYTGLVDSNLDWGQDLPALRDRLATPDGRPVYLAYFGTGRPSYYGIRATPLPPPDAQDRTAWKPGRYCISATWLVGVYESRRRTWDSEKETRYWNGSDLAELRYTRLLIHLRNRRPDDTAGFSILIYDVTEEELRAVLDSRAETGPLAVPPLEPGSR